jgi:hypothetical protein
MTHLVTDVTPADQITNPDHLTPGEQKKPLLSPG